MNIAVTGGLGTGKSTVSKVLAAALEADLIDTDQLCRQQLQPGEQGYDKFKQRFGDTFLQNDGAIDRAILRQAVFDDETVRNELEKILHPLVKHQVIRFFQVSSCENKDLVVEVPLLFEAHWQADFDSTIVIYVPTAVCRERVMQRDNMSGIEIEKVMASQLDILQKVDLADFCIDNSGILASTVMQTAWLARKLKE